MGGLSDIVDGFLRWMGGLCFGGVSGAAGEPGLAPAGDSLSLVFAKRK